MADTEARMRQHDVLSGKIMLMIMQEYKLETNMGSGAAVLGMLSVLGLASAKTLASLSTGAGDSVTKDAFEVWTLMVQKTYLSLEGCQPLKVSLEEGHVCLDKMAAKL